MQSCAAGQLALFRLHKTAWTSIHNRCSSASLVLTHNHDGLVLQHRRGGSGWMDGHVAGVGGTAALQVHSDAHHHLVLQPKRQPAGGDRGARQAVGWASARVWRRACRPCCWRPARAGRRRHGAAQLLQRSWQATGPLGTPSVRMGWRCDGQEAPERRAGMQPGSDAHLISLQPGKAARSRWCASAGTALRLHAVASWIARLSFSSITL